LEIFQPKGNPESGRADFPEKELNQPRSNAQITIVIRIQ
jgi:hypothetical protein